MESKESSRESQESESKGTDASSDFELVLDFDSENWWTVYEKKYGLYCRYSGDWWGDDEIVLEGVEWRHEFTGRGFYDNRESPYLIYWRDGTYSQTPFSGEKEYCSHIVQDGETICHIDVNVPAPEVTTVEKCREGLPKEVPYPTFESLIPVDLVERERLDSSPFCTHCLKQSRRKAILPIHDESA